MSMLVKEVLAGQVTTYGSPLKISVFKTLFALYVALAPFIYFMPKVWPFEVNLVTILAMLLIAVGAVAVVPLRIYTHARFFLICCSILLLSHIVISMRSYGVLVVLTESYSLCIFLLSLLFFSEPGRLQNYQRYVKLIAIIGAVAGVVSLCLKLSLISVPSVLAERFVIGGRTGTAVDGAISVLGQVCALTLLFAKEAKTTKYLYAAYALCFVNVLLSGYRTYLAVSILMLLFMLSCASLKQKVHFSTFIFAIAMLVGWSGFDLSSSGISRFYDVLNGRSFKNEESMQWRALELDLEIEEISQNPFVGSGWGLSSRETVSRAGMGTLSAFGHNQYTSFAARTGLPVTAFFWGLWFCWLGKSYTLYRTKRSDERVLYLGSFSILSAVLLGGWTQNFILMTLFAPALAVFICPLLNQQSIVRH